ncbi:MAG: GHKL domain-containing protein [Proteobacteria bacterium]|nr:GHKL domain-containing protein [Pseudomonadota bacterium]
MNEIIEAVMKATKGNYSVRIALTGEDDQFDTFARGFNTIAANIQEKEKEYNQTLKELQVTSDNLFWQSQELKARNEEFEAYADLLLIQKYELEKKTADIIEVNKKLYTEIAKRKQIEKALRSSKNKLEQTLTKLAETQTYMIQSEKMASIGQLAAGVAHEINNPTGFVSSNLKTLSDYIQDISSLSKEYRKLISELKKDRDGGGHHEISGQVKRIETLEEEVDFDFVLKDVFELIDESKEGTERIKKIVQDLKDFAHPGEDKPKFADINQNMDSTVNVVWNELKYKADVTKDYGDLPQIQCYPQLLNQVFVNLLVNAAQAIDDRGEIRIKTRADNGYVEIRISDTGTGIPKENLPKIFDPFYTTKDVGKGTGLGLNVAYNIIKKHHGKIDVESEVSKGTTFTIRIPITED